MNAKAKENIKTKRARLAQGGESGFQVPGGVILYDELRKNKIDVKHNVHLWGTEIDLYVPPAVMPSIRKTTMALVKVPFNPVMFFHLELL